MLVRLASTPIGTSPFDVLFDRSRLFPDIAWPGIAAKTEIYPSVNIADVNNTLQVVAEVPGVPKDNINIQLHGDVLTISGERKEQTLAEGATSMRQEIAHGYFERSFQLPYEINAANVTAEYRDGILRIVLPKVEAEKPKSISIQ